MTETKFTPGPWIVEPSHASTDPVIVVMRKVRTVICSKHPVLDDDSNANLIAAAPDLYEALEKANLELKQLHHDLFHTLYKNDEIEKALKKARGETE